MSESVRSYTTACRSPVCTVGKMFPIVFTLVQKIGLMVDGRLFAFDALSHNEETDLFCISSIFAIIFTSIYLFSFFFNIFYLPHFLGEVVLPEQFWK